MLTQPISLITGTPGAGKTLRAIYEALELQKEGREVFALGIDGLDSDLIESLPDDWKIEDWSKLPDGAVLFVDEAHKYFPVRTKDKVPEWMSALTEIRHSGKGLVLITQDPRNIDAFVRRLVGEHLHLTRKAGFNGSLLRTFPGVSDNPDDYHARASSSAVPWVFPKTLFKHYKSASLHTIKPKVPFKIWLALLFGLVLLIVVPIAIFKFRSFTGGSQESASQTPQSPASASNPFSSSSSGERSYATAQDYVKDHTPLVPVAPWSAPIYHSREPTSIPKIYCIESGTEKDKNLSCNCKTEQATKIENIPFLICRKIVRDGIYNPFLERFENQPAQESGGKSLPSPAPAGALITSPVFNNDTITPKRDSVH